MSRLTAPSPVLESPSPVPPQLAMMERIFDAWVSRSIYVAAKLGIADHVQPGGTSCDQLAALTQTDARSLYRLLRALASVGIFEETAPQQFSLTPLAESLRTDMPGSMRFVAIMTGEEIYQAWGNLMHSIRTGDPTFDHMYGMNAFEYYAQNPEPAQIFDQAMTNFSALEKAAVVANYDFSGLHRIVDVAGGQGSLLVEILNHYPDLQGTLFDVPEVIERAKATISPSPVADRCTLTPGSFFDTVPAGGDAYLLKHIIHDWGDEQSLVILRHCRAAMAPTSKLLIIEQVIPPGNEPFIGKFLDLHMLIMCPGGCERTAAEYTDLLAQAGLTLTRIIPTPAIVSIIEAVPA